jgi:hypothetical protein
MEDITAPAISNSATCNSCKDLKPLSQEISFTDLTRSAAAGCNSCQLVQNGVKSFEQQFEVIDRLRLVVDLSLYVSVLGRKSKELGDSEYTNDDAEEEEPTRSSTLRLIEFYTAQGRSHLSYMGDHGR